jgi:hypothetical protein
VLIGGFAPRLLGAVVIGGLIGGLGSSPPGQITPVEMMTWRWNQFWKSIIPSGWLRRLLIVSLFFDVLFGGLLVGRGFGLRIGLVGGLLCGLITGLNRGGDAVIQHYALRLILWLYGYTSFNFIKFLDHCDRLILLKKVGGGYIFIHRMLLEYFAGMTPSDPRGRRMEQRGQVSVSYLLIWSLKDGRGLPTTPDPLEIKCGVWFYHSRSRMAKRQGVTL